MRRASGYVAVGRIGLPATASLELEWCFNLAQVQLGLSSNLGALLLRADGGDVDSRTPEDRADAMTAYRRILGWLRLMPNVEAGVLQAAFETRVWPPRVRQFFGTNAGVAVRLACAAGGLPDDPKGQDVVLSARAADLDLRCREPSEARSMRALRAAAVRRRLTAIDAYLAVRGAGPCPIPKECLDELTEDDDARNLADPDSSHVRAR